MERIVFRSNKRTMMILWRDLLKSLRLFWHEIRLVFVLGFAVCCLIIWCVDYANVLYYVISILACFGFSFGLMFRKPEKKKEFQGDA